MHEIIIDESGDVRTVDPQLADVLSGLGATTRRRASHVEPVDPILRLVFRAIRRLVDDGGAIAAWTRRWPVAWRSAVIGGPTFGPYRQRADAIAAELSWLRSHLAEGE